MIFFFLQSISGKPPGLRRNSIPTSSSSIDAIGPKPDIVRPIPAFRSTGSINTVSLNTTSAGTGGGGGVGGEGKMGVGGGGGSANSLLPPNQRRYSTSTAPLSPVSTA